MNSYETTTIINAIEYAWQAIQANHDDVPDVIVTMGAGATIRGLKLGHFAAQKWQRGDAVVCELFVGGEGLERGAKGVLGTLLHEAAHGVAFVRDIQDTSRQGRYHNAKFRDIANELGITVDHVDIIGWSKTSLPDSTASVYSDEISKLDKALVAFRKGVIIDDSGTPKVIKPRTKMINLHCPVCDRTAKMPKKDYSEGILHCVECDEHYYEV